MIRRLAPALFALSFAAACGGAALPASPSAPPRAPSADELAAMGPQGAAEHLSGLSLGLDAARVSAALVAAATCPFVDRPCRAKRKAEALESFASAAEGLRALVALQHELAGPGGPHATGPDDGDVSRRLDLAPPVEAP
jgi:hypothetical protein